MERLSAMSCVKERKVSVCDLLKGDKKWKRQQDIALKAREMGSDLRSGKPESFRMTVGSVHR